MVISATKRQTDLWDVQRDDVPVGTVVKSSYGYFANPIGSPFQSIPCRDWQDGFETCARLAITDAAPAPVVSYNIRPEEDA